MTEDPPVSAGRSQGDGRAPRKTTPGRRVGLPHPDEPHGRVEERQRDEGRLDDVGQGRAPPVPAPRGISRMCPSSIPLTVGRRTRDLTRLTSVPDGRSSTDRDADASTTGQGGRHRRAHPERHDTHRAPALRMRRARQTASSCSKTPKNRARRPRSVAVRSICITAKPASTSQWGRSTPDLYPRGVRLVRLCVSGQVGPGPLTGRTRTGAREQTRPRNPSRRSDGSVTSQYVAV